MKLKKGNEFYYLAQKDWMEVAGEALAGVGMVGLVFCGVSDRVETL